MTNTGQRDETRYEGPVISMGLCPLVKKNVYARARELMRAGEYPLLPCIERAAREYFPGWVTRWLGFTLKIYDPDSPNKIYYME
jgi:hypothetical protein